jgi:Spy/CpxP family protein refolding chaperone
MLRTSSSSRFSFVVGAFLVAAAGVAGVTFTAGTARADGGDTSADGGAHHGGKGHHRPHDLLHAALRLPDLTDAQRSQIHTLEQGKRGPREAARAAHEALAQAVAAQVGAPNVTSIDRSTLTAQLKAVSDAEAAVSTANAAALTGLHGVLTPAQRTELADGVSAKITEHEQKRAAHEAEKNADANAKAPGDRGGPWSRALGLSPAQETQIRANLKAAGISPPPRGGFEAQIQQELADFKKASFTAPVTAGGRPVGRMVDMAQAALPVLTNAQRTELANLLRGSQPDDGT